MGKKFNIILAALWLGLFLLPKLGYSCDEKTISSDVNTEEHCPMPSKEEQSKSCCNDGHEHGESKDCDKKCAGHICQIPAKAPLAHGHTLVFSIPHTIDKRLYWKNNMFFPAVYLPIWQPPQLV